jgi:hypothetical protein
MGVKIEKPKSGGVIFERFSAFSKKEKTNLMGTGMT